MKYRQKPSDFIVEEIVDYIILNNENDKRANYKLYLLTKEDIETFSLIEQISSENNIPKKEIGFAGLKDTHARTKQYISIPKKYEIKNKFSNNKNNYNSYTIEFVGYIENRINLGNLTENKFTITINELDKYDVADMYEYSKQINHGIVNYFDSQRFGSVKNKIFIGKYLIQKRFEDAVKYYLTTYIESESKQIIEDKKNILKSWGRFDCKINDYQLRYVILEYKKTKNWLRTYQKISPSLKEMYVAAYQSYLWNECVKKLIRKNVPEKNIVEVPYAIDELMFFREQVDLPQTFTTISHKIELSEDEKEIVDEVLAKENLTLSQFNIRQTGNFFKSHERNILIYPKNFKIFEPVKKENGYSVTISFELPKGSYATIVLKYLFGK
jgi:tRNA pseudouridine13 synthase